MSGTFNGIGTTFYGSKDQYPDNTFVTTEWFVIFYFPIIPIQSVRVAFIGSSTGWRRTTSEFLIIKRLPLDGKQILFTYCIQIAIILVTLLIGWAAANIFTDTNWIAIGTIIGFSLSSTVSARLYYAARSKSSPNPSPLLVFPAISGFTLIIFFIISRFFYPPVKQNSYLSTPIPIISSPTPRPKQVQIRPTLTQPKLNYHGVPCVSWESITNEDLESHICVYGKVYAPANSSNWAGIQFSPSENSFRVIDFNFYYTSPIKAGDCVAIFGRIRDNGAYLIITPDKDAPDSVRIGPASVCDN